jgi:hypothetical protein
MARRGGSNHGKVILMALFVLADIGFNSSLDYDTYNDSIDRNYKLGFFGLQVTLQICIFLTLFLAAADTFLFRIGSFCSQSAEMCCAVLCSTEVRSTALCSAKVLCCAAPWSAAFCSA